MAATEISVIERGIQKTSILTNMFSLVIAIITASSVCYGFYYTTNSTLDHHTIEIKATANDIILLKEQLKDSAIRDGVIDNESKNMKEQLNRLEDKLDRTEDKLDRTIELMLNLNKNYKQSAR